MDAGRLALSFGVSFLGSLAGGAMAAGAVAFFVSDWAVQRHEAAAASTFTAISGRFDSVDDRLGRIEATLAEIQAVLAMNADPFESDIFVSIRDELADLVVRVDAQAEQIRNLTLTLSVIMQALDINPEIPREQ